MHNGLILNSEVQSPMSRFLAVYEPVEEGWGMAISKVGVLMGLGAFIANPLVGGAVLGAAVATGSKLNSKAKEAYTKVLNSPKMQKYIVSECDKVYAKLVKKYKNDPSYKLNKDTTLNTLMNHADKNISDSESSSEAYVQNNGFLTKVGKYSIYVLADTKHVDSIKVFFTLEPKTKDKHLKLLSYVLPAPTNDEIKAMGYRKE